MIPRPSEELARMFRALDFESGVQQFWLHTHDSAPLIAGQEPFTRDFQSTKCYCVSDHEGGH